MKDGPAVWFPCHRGRIPGPSGRSSSYSSSRRNGSGPFPGDPADDAVTLPATGVGERVA